MKFLKLVWQAAGDHRSRLFLAALASTLGSLGVLTVINGSLEPGSAEANFGRLLLFVVAACGVIGGYAAGQRVAAAVVEELLDRVRVRTATLVRRIDYDRFEAIGGHSIYDVLARSSSTMTEATMMVIPGIASFGALILGGFYTLLLSPLVFVVIAVLIPTSILFYHLSQRRTHEALARASQVRERFYGLLRHLLDGFKEVKLNEQRGDAVEYRHLRPESGELRDAQVHSARQINRGVSVSMVFFYLMLGTIAFALPPFVGEHLVIVQSVYVAVYMLGIVEAILKAVPMLTRAGFAIEELDDLEATLEEAARDEEPLPRAVDFQTISGQDLLYSYYDPDGAKTFTMGPTSFELTKGETLFVVGGNGSGKSTLLKTLTRLYRPQSGTLRWDGMPVEADKVRAYRNLFSSVFSDFHLFDRLYGMEGIPEARVNTLLEDLGIAHKTSYRDGRFTNAELSTGQRKRLALAIALLEDRPILVLDELAADQDPAFRRRFYGELVPRWKAEGRTLVIVSHDDRYFHLADRALILADGRIKEMAPAASG